MLQRDDIDELLSELAAMQARLQQTPDGLDDEQSQAAMSSPQTLIQSTMKAYLMANPTSALSAFAPVKRILDVDTTNIGQAIDDLERAYDLYLHVGDETGMGIAIGMLGHADIALGNVPSAIANFAQSMGHFINVQDDKNTSRCGVNIGVCKAALGDYYKVLATLADVTALIPYAERIKKSNQFAKDVVDSFMTLEDKEESLRRYAVALIPFQR